MHQRAMPPSAMDFTAFTARVGQAKKKHPGRLLDAGRGLVDGALRIRRGGDGLYGELPARPVTKPAEAVGAWLEALSEEAADDAPFYRHAEAREALVAAAEEVQAATEQIPRAERLQGALYLDALDRIGLGSEGRSSLRAAVPWIVAASLAGILVGVFLRRR